jgi:hypothetical protein
MAFWRQKLDIFRDYYIGVGHKDLLNGPRWEFPSLAFGCDLANSAKKRNYFLLVGCSATLRSFKRIQKYPKEYSKKYFYKKYSKNQKTCMSKLLRMRTLLNGPRWEFPSSPFSSDLANFFQKKIHNKNSKKKYSKIFFY